MDSQEILIKEHAITVAQNMAHAMIATAKLLAETQEVFDEAYAHVWKGLTPALRVGLTPPTK